LPNKERKMDENQETSAAEELTQAAEEAVADQQTTQETEETTEETEEVAETTEEVVEEQAEELPTDHKERSNLGRKLTALHRRVDETDNQFGDIKKQLESLIKQNVKDPLESLEPDEPVTRKEMESILEARERLRESRDKSYNENYVRTISGLGSDLGQEEYDAVLAEMRDVTYDPTDNPERDAEMNFLKAEKIYLRKVTYDPTDNPERDAEMNFLKAEKIYLRKKMAKPADKVNPLKGEKPKDKLGVATTQTSVTKETKQPKLDDYAQSYLDSVRRRSGDEYADKLLKD
jgi:regulator of replication initiation timing